MIAILYPQPRAPLALRVEFRAYFTPANPELHTPPAVPSLPRYPLLFSVLCLSNPAKAPAPSPLS